MFKPKEPASGGRKNIMFDELSISIDRIVGVSRFENEVSIYVEGLEESLRFFPSDYSQGRNFYSSLVADLERTKKFFSYKVVD